MTMGNASLRTRSVQLRAVRSSDQDWLYELLTADSGSRWRYRGRTPNPAEFAQDLWRGVQSQFVVTTAAGAPVGLVGTYNANPTAGHCHLFAVGVADCGPQVTEAAGLLINWAFDEFDLHKIWIEAAEFNLAQFASLTTVADIEGRLTNFDFWRGRFWDVLILSINRQRWDERHRGVLERRADPVGAGASVRLSQDDIEALLEDFLPLDSLGTVEVLSDLEERLDQPLDVTILSGLDELNAHDAATLLHQRLDTAAACDVASQHELGGFGRATGNGHSTSAVANTETSRGPVACT